MAAKKSDAVTMRVRVADSELEITGPKDFAEKKISEFLAAVTKQIGPISALDRKGSVSQTIGTATGQRKEISTAQFFKKVKPQTDIDRVLAAGYYLETYRNMDNFTAGEIRETIRNEAKTQPPGNTNNLINANIKKGYMMSAGDKEGKKAFVLTSDGEDAINTLLAE